MINTEVQERQQQNKQKKKKGAKWVRKMPENTDVPALLQQQMTRHHACQRVTESLCMGLGPTGPISL